MGLRGHICRFHLSLLFLFTFDIVSSTRVAITSCPPDHYAVLNELSSSITACKQCTACPPGYGVEEPCTATKNTVCAPCETGTFSDSESSAEGCQACRSCSETRIVKECTAYEDTVCQKQCSFGEFYDPSTDLCTLCSYCFPDRPFARTIRVVECQLQGLHVDMQCSPLPAVGAGDSWPPPVAAAPRNVGVTTVKGTAHNRVFTGDLGSRSGRTREADGGERSGSDLLIEIGTSQGLGDKRPSVQDQGIDGTRGDSRPRPPSTVFSEDDFSFFSSVDYDEIEPGLDQTSFNDVAINPGTENEEENNYGESFFSKSDSEYSNVDYQSFTDSPISEYSIDDVNHNDFLETPKFGDTMASSSRQYRALSTTDIVLVVVIALSTGLISMIVTAITCYCVMKRGKNVGPRVSVVKTKKPSNAWTYVDLMPPVETERTSLVVVDTPPQTRKMTCV